MESYIGNITVSHKMENSSSFILQVTLYLLFVAPTLTSIAIFVAVLIVFDLLCLLFSCEGAALEVLMSVCPSVCLSVCPQVEILKVPSFQKVPEGYRMFQKVPEGCRGSRRLQKVTEAKLQ